MRGRAKRLCEASECPIGGARGGKEVRDGAKLALLLDGALQLPKRARDVCRARPRRPVAFAAIEALLATFVATFVAVLPVIRAAVSRIIPASHLGGCATLRASVLTIP